MYGALLFFTFFTSWYLALVVFHRFTHPNVNLVLLAFLVSFVGALITYIRPRLIVLRLDESHEVTLSGWSLCLADFIFHQLPLAFVLFTYMYVNRKGGHATTGALPTMAALALVTVYALMFDVIDVYRINVKDLVTTVLAVIGSTAGVTALVA